MGSCEEQNRKRVLAKIDDLMAKIDESDSSKDELINASIEELQSTISESGIDSQTLRQLYIEAIEQKPSAILLIPKTQRNFEICLAFVKKTKTDELLYCIPEALQINPKIFLEIVRKYPKVLKECIPD